MAKNIHGAAIANKAEKFYGPTMAKIFMAQPWSEIILGPITLIHLLEISIFSTQPSISHNFSLEWQSLQIGALKKRFTALKWPKIFMALP